MNGPFDPRQEGPLLSAYVDGELEAVEVARIEALLAAPGEAAEYARAEIAKLRRLKQVTGTMRLHEPPPEAWEAFWENVYNRAERSLGWILVGIGAVVIGAWGAVAAVSALVADDSLPLYLKGGIFAVAAGLLLLLISAVRERLHKRSRTRYKDIIR